MKSKLFKIGVFFSSAIILVLGLISIVATGGGGNRNAFISPCFPFPETDCLPTLPPEPVPTEPEELSAAVVSSTFIELNWNASTDVSGQVGYIVYRDGMVIDSSYSTTYLDSMVNPLSQYCYSIIAANPYGSRSGQSDAVCVSTPEGIETPTAPQNVSLSQIISSDGQEGVHLSWSQSTDDSAPAGYNIYRDGSLLGNTSALLYNDYTIKAGSDHCYAVSTYDAAENESPMSKTLCSAASWTVAIIEKGSSLHYPSIDIDSGNTVHVGYVDNNESANTGFIHYANNIFGNWSSSVIDTSLSTSECSALSVDGADVVHMVYCSSTDGLIYARSDAAAWGSDRVGDILVALHPSLDTDADQSIHLASLQGSVVTYTTNKSGEWVSIPVMDIGVTGDFPPALAVDTLGFVHISFYEYRNSDLIYATNKSGSWTTELVDSHGEVGGYSSIVVDASQKVHISYYDFTDHNLKYATNAFGPWSMHSIDDTGEAGFPSSIVVDRSNHAHIAHLQAKQLLYTNNFSGKWRTFIIYGQSGVSGQPSLAIDSRGHLHIVYLSDGGTTIRLATTQ